MPSSAVEGKGIGTALVHDSAAIESVEFSPLVDKGSLKESSCIGYFRLSALNLRITSCLPGATVLDIAIV